MEHNPVIVPNTTGRFSLSPCTETLWHAADQRIVEIKLQSAPVRSGGSVKSEIKFLHAQRPGLTRSGQRKESEVQEYAFGARMRE